MFEIFEADLKEAEHGAALISLMEEYALDPMGGGEALSAYVKDNLVKKLGQWPGSHVVLAIATESLTPAGLIVCLEGFSTFACQPLMNIHDVIVSKTYRRQGLSQRMLQKVEDIARAKGCCKLTLEVLEGNEPARMAYENFGFANYQLDPKMGNAMFWQKKLKSP